MRRSVRVIVAFAIVNTGRVRNASGGVCGRVGNCRWCGCVARCSSASRTCYNGSGPPDSPWAPGSDGLVVDGRAPNSGTVVKPPTESSSDANPATHPMDGQGQTGVIAQGARMSGDGMAARVGYGAPTRDGRHFRPELARESSVRTPRVERAALPYRSIGRKCRSYICGCGPGRAVQRIATATTRPRATCAAETTNAWGRMWSAASTAPMSMPVTHSSSRTPPT